jgi:hypothetical protein
LPALAEMLIMWFVPNFFFGWKIGRGGEGLQAFNKINGQYVSVYVAFGGSVTWILIVNYWLFPGMSNIVEGVFATISPSDFPLVALVMLIIAFAVFKRGHWA